MIFCPDGIIPDSGLTGLNNTHTHTHTHTHTQNIYIYIFVGGRKCKCLFLENGKISDCEN